MNYKPERPVFSIGTHKAIGCGIAVSYYEHFELSLFILCFDITLCFKRKDHQCNWVEIN